MLTAGIEFPEFTAMTLPARYSAPANNSRFLTISADAAAERPVQPGLTLIITG